MAGRVLIVEDDARERMDLAETVASFGYEVATATDGKDALQKLASFPANAILTDLMMPRMDGFTLLKELQNRGDHTPAIVLTGFGSIDQAIGVVHDLKAFWFMEKPVTASMMQGLLVRAIQQNELVEETERLNRQLAYQGVLGDLVGEAPCMQEIFSVIRQVAPTTASVFISGESGTGKELVARAIHTLSRRSSGPFVAVNCAALPETLIEGELFGHEKGAYTGALERRAGCFEQAQNGTLFLDEIGEMPVGTQAKLLRVIEESRVRRLGGLTDIPVSVRVLAATNRAPAKAIEDKALREDLFYRLNVFHISLPPLRERTQDIPAISAALIGSLNKKHNCRVTSLSPEVTQRFMSNAWPGNVRELRNIIERAVIVAGEGEIRLQHLPGAVMPQTIAAPAAGPEAIPDDVLQLRAGMPMAEVEKAYLKLTLKHTNNNKRRAAQILGLCLRTLHNKLNSYNASPEKGTALRGAAHAARAD